MSENPLCAKTFLPIFSMDWFGLLRRIQKIEGNYGVLAPINCSDNFLRDVRTLNKPFFIDSAIFEKAKCPWYYQPSKEFSGNRWIRRDHLAGERVLRQFITGFFERCDLFSPDYVLTPDIFNEPLLSLHIARIAIDEYSTKPRTYELVGVVQVGYTLYTQQDCYVPLQKDAPLPHYKSVRSFLAPLISEYKNIGYEQIALGGLLKAESTMPTGWKFGLSPEQLDDLLSWSRPNLVLGGLALTRLEVLKKHNVWADSTNWLWWDSRYDYERFGHRNALHEVVN